MSSDIAPGCSESTADGLKKDLLSSLPDELILLVAEELSIHSLNALIQASKRFYFSLTSNLYTAVLGEKSGTSNTPHAIAFAARTGNLAAIKKFLTYVAPQDERINLCWASALVEATQNGHVHIVLFLLDLGVVYQESTLRGCLLIAARGNHVNIVETLIDAGVDISSPCDLDRSPLAAAARAYQGDPATVKLLCDRGAYRDARDEVDDTVLHGLARLGSFDMLQFFLDMGHPVDPQNIYGDTPLFEAVRCQNHSAVLLLVSRGANISVFNNSGSTPLHLAAASRTTSAPAIVELLLDLGADVNGRSGTNKTPLHMATKGGGGDQHLVEVLLAAGADCSAIVDEHDRTTPLLNVLSSGYYQHPSISLLMDAGGADNPEQDTRSMITWAVHHNLYELVRKLVDSSPDPTLPEFLSTWPLHEAVRPRREKILEFLLTKVVNVDWRSQFGTTPLAQAATCCASPETVRLLLERNAYADAQDRYGDTALMHAAQNSTAEVTAMILSKTADPLVTNPYGQSALHFAIEGRREDTVSLLLKHGLSPTQTDRDGVSPINIAIRRGNSTIVQTLLSYPEVDIETRDLEGNTPLTTACKEGNHPIAELLLSHGANPNAPAKHGTKSYPHSRSPLCIACETGNANLVRSLLSHGADTESSSASSSATHLSQKPLGIAASKNHTEIISLLLSYGTSIDAIISSPALHRTALTQAAEHGHLDAVSLLLSHNASVVHQDYYGRTPLSHAAENGHTSIVELLVHHHHTADAQIDLPDAKGQTPLFWAVLRARQHTAEVLIRAGADVTHGNRDGLTPISLAMRAGDEGLIRVLYGTQQET